MTITPDSRRRRLIATTWLFGLLLLTEGALVAIASLAVTLQTRSSIATVDAAFALLGACAIVGVVIAALAIAGCVAALRGRPLQLLTVSRNLAWLRLIAIPVAAVLIAATIGPSAITGLSNGFVVCLALLVAGYGLYGVSSAYRLVANR